MNKKLDELRRLANDLPHSPGVYLMYDRGGTIIYVGKSKALHDRVSQYFAPRGHDNFKTDRMVSHVDRFEYMLTGSEIEALTLENRLIKLHKPRYNILLKDDKSYPYIKVTVADEYPRVEFTRKRANDKARYFGPYSGAGVAGSLIRTIQRVFGTPRCNKRFPRDIGKERPCMYAQLGQCAAPCTGKITPEEYRVMIDDVLRFLGGSFSDVRESLEKKMRYASDNLLFEIAARHRDSIRELSRLWDRQIVVGKPDAEYDVISSWQDEKSECVAVFYVREGAVSDRERFTFGADSIMDGDGMTSFICELYTKREFIPGTVLLGDDVGEENISLLSRYLSERAGRKVSVRVPKRGDLRSLCDMVRDNARQYAKEYEKEYERTNDTLIKLASMLSLEVVPERIEACDISNFGSDNITGAIISVVDGKFNKQGYRTYKIRSTDTPDDYASMRETISRRLDHPENPYPDLFLLDGGRGHVGVIRDLLEERGIEIPVFGMVKDDFHKTRALVSVDMDEISIAREQSVFQLIYKIQEEIHRFAVTSMSRAKSKTLTRSSLEKIPGVGPSKARDLLAAFGTVGAIKSASVEELAACKGISRKNAESIYGYYHKSENGEG
ncbi:MAG: excinuclease ABC subunit UvrC [Clostridia bacterium]|nr:excinuclease ABC subunit UvrC [Clostridia bacterium]